MVWLLLALHDIGEVKQIAYLLLWVVLRHLAKAL